MFILEMIRLSRVPQIASPTMMPVNNGSSGIPGGAVSWVGKVEGTGHARSARMAPACRGRGLRGAEPDGPEWSIRFNQSPGDDRAT